MKLTKYDGRKEKSGNTTLIGGGGGSSSGNLDIPTRGGGGSLDRSIWGQHDTGDDVDGSATINGNVQIKCITPPTYDPDDEGDDGENEDAEEGGGNLDVELDVTVGRHLFVNNPHPDHNGEKVCILDYIKSLILPVGSIIMYNGNSTLPDGWFVCNGHNGTPDLRGKFIKASDTAGTTGGNNKITLSPSQLPSHRHSVTLTPTDWFVMSKSNNLSEFVVDKGGSSNYCLYTGGDGGENYNTIGSVSGYTDYEGTTVGSTGETIDIQPEFYSLIFIMKVR